MSEKINLCPLCSESVDDLLLAFADPDTEGPAHFDCVFRLLAEAEPVDSGEKLCYLGGGGFGVVRIGRGRRAVRIRKRIQYESETAVPEWRRGLVRTPSVT